MANLDIDFLLSKNEEKQQNEPYWTKLEKEILLEEVSCRIKIIDGKFKGALNGKADKNRAWEEITSIVNAKGNTKKRTTKQVKKQWSNMKQRAKRLNSEGKYPSTGGGPKPPSPSPMDEAMLSLLAGKPSLEGISGGLETCGQNTCIQASTSLQDQPSQSKDQPVTVLEMTREEPEPEPEPSHLTASQTKTSPKQVSGKRKRKFYQCNINDIHSEVLYAEKEKLKLEGNI